MPIVLIATLCGLGGLLSGWFAARQAARYIPDRRQIAIRQRLGITVICGVLSAFIGVRYAGQGVLAAYLVLVAVLVAASWIDLATHRLPRELTYPAAAACYVLLLYAAWADDLWSHALTALAGGAIAMAMMSIVWALSRGQLGGGDVRLAPLLGVNLGYLSLGAVPTGLFVGFLLAALVSLVGLATGRWSRTTQIAFGPYLAAGTLITLLWFAGQPLI